MMYKPQILLNLIAFLVLCLLCWPLWGQTDKCIRIQDAETQAALANVHVTLDDKLVGSTNHDGRYCFDGHVTTAQTITFSHLGYLEKSVEWNRLQGDLLVSLQPQAYELTPAQVVAASTSNKQISMVRLNQDRILSQPAMMGEVDPLKVLAFEPGVMTGREGTAGLYIRGGSPGQNLYLLDDIPMYNTEHLFGYLSTVNPMALASMTAHKGHIPAQYGSRASAVVDIKTREGHEKERHWGYKLGLLSNSIYAEGPIKANQTTYFVSTRIANISVLTWPVAQLFNAGSINEFATFNLYDINTKLTHKFKDSSKLIFSLYGSQDRLPLWSREDEATMSTILKQNNRQGNISTSLRWIRSKRKTSFVKTILYYTRYTLGQEYDLFEEANDRNKVLSSEGSDLSSFEDLGLKHQQHISLGRLNLEVGTDINYFKIQPNRVSITEYSQAGGNILRTNPGQHLYGFTPYAEVDGAYGDLSLNIGLRSSLYTGTDYLDVVLEPRLAITYDPGANMFVEYAFSRLSQPVHLLSANNVGFPLNLWIASGENLSATRSFVHSLDAGFPFGNNGDWKLQTGLYYKVFSDLVDFRRGANFRFDTREPLVEKVVQGGEGQAYGLELVIQHDYNWIESRLAMTWARSERRFDAINNGQWTRSNFDRLFSLDYLATFNLTDQLTLASTFSFATGYPVTVAEGFAHGLFRGVQPFFPGRNNAEMPDYWRCDLQLTKSYKTRKKGREAWWSINIYNAFMRFNPVELSIQGRYRPLIFGDPNSLFRGSSKKQGTAYFRFIPSFSFGRKF